jgi:hypothetical protein
MYGQAHNQTCDKRIRLDSDSPKRRTCDHRCEGNQEKPVHHQGERHCQWLSPQERAGLFGVVSAMFRASIAAANPPRRSTRSPPIPGQESSPDLALPRRPEPWVQRSCRPVNKSAHQLKRLVKQTPNREEGNNRGKEEEGTNKSITK